jgi:predicted glycosyltransferase
LDLLILTAISIDKKERSKRKNFLISQKYSINVKIWFDILTPKQIMFFNPAIAILKRDGHNILGTSRNYREANELSRLKGLHLIKVGSHGGSNLYDKLFQSSKRIVKLTKIVSEFSPHLVVSFSSPEASRVAFGLGIKHIGFNDSPHAEAVARLTIPLLSTLFTPSAIPLSAWKKFGISSKNIIRYNGLDPMAWLNQKYAINTVRANHSDPSNLSNKLHYSSNLDHDFFGSLRIDETRKSILIRLEESKAAYISDKNLRIQPLSFVDHIVNTFGPKNNVMVLCRYPDQIREMSKRFANKAIVLKQVIDGVNLLKKVDVFIGAGGTMTAESALLGKPTISIAPIQFYIDDYLKKIGLVKQVLTTYQLDKLINSFLSDQKKCKEVRNKANKITKEMENPIEKLINYISTMSKK